jgi:hypothetical protein
MPPSSTSKSKAHKQSAGNLLSVSCWVLGSCQYIPPTSWWTSTGVQNVTSQMTVLFKVTNTVRFSKTVMCCWQLIHVCPESSLQYLISSFPALEKEQIALSTEQVDSSSQFQIMIPYIICKIQKLILNFKWSTPYILTQSNIYSFFSSYMNMGFNICKSEWHTYCHIFGVCVTNNTGFWILWSNLLDLYTAGYNSSQITIWRTVIFFWLDTPLELFWLPTELLCTPLYSSYSFVLLQFFWLCPLTTPWHGPHGKHRLLLSRMRVYWSVT